MTMMERGLPGLLVGLMMLAAASGAGAAALSEPWPEGEDLAAIEGIPVTFASHSPFTLTDVGNGAEDDPPHDAHGTLFLPPGASAAAPVPAVVMLHGASGVQGPRELTYGRQLAAMGVAALAIDAFSSRRDLGRGFVERILNITESMFLADAYAALRRLAARPEIDGERVVLIGFSYGAMAATYAAYSQVAELFAPGGERFAAHVAFYGPCVARFEDSTTTGAPVLMLWGSEDAIIDPARCAETAADLERGGSAVETIVYEGAAHQWDAHRGPWQAPRNLAGCDFRVEANGQVRDRFTRLAMNGPFTRRIILALCTDGDGYLISRDDAVRARSNQDLGRFLSRVLGAV
jgi:dienelactone hydrolase